MATRNHARLRVNTQVHCLHNSFPQNPFQGVRMPRDTVSAAKAGNTAGAGPDPAPRPGSRTMRNRAMSEIYTGVRLRLADLC